MIVYSAVILLGGLYLRMYGFNCYIFSALMLVGLALITFSRLTVEVADRVIEVVFGLRFIRRSILVSKIEAHRIVRNPWYYLLGIRYTPRGWLFSVSGSSAVEIKLKGGRLYRIGSDVADKLANAIGEAISIQAEH